MENGLRSGWRETPIDFSISSEEFFVNDMIFGSTFLIHTISSPPTNLVYMHLIQKERKFVRNNKRVDSTPTAKRRIRQTMDSFNDVENRIHGRN